MSKQIKDVFICHTSEDKEEIVEPLVDALRQAKITYWYDEAEIAWGDSIIQKVNEGLKVSRYVIVILSIYFVKKKWPQRELNAVLNIEASREEVKVLPLIIGTKKEQAMILEEYPLLNDKRHLLWDGELNKVVKELKIRLGKKTEKNVSNLSISKIRDIPSFSKTIISISFIRWRDRTKSKPFVKGKRISHLGEEFFIDVYDESLIYAEWTPNRDIIKDFVREHQTSGFLLLEPIQPQLLTIDEKSYQRSRGKILPVKYKLFKGNSISYTTRRFNAYQERNQDFRFPFSYIQVDNFILSLNFAPILGDAAFKELPIAFIYDDDNLSKREYIELDSWYGKTWCINCNLKNQKGYVKVSWKLCDGKPPGKKYVFGYGSLMYPNSINRSLENFSNRNSQLIPAKLKGYKRAWSAFRKNKDGAKSNEDTPEYLAFMNIEAQTNSRALGVLVEVSDRDLEQLDIRENIYVRINVTQRIEALNCTLPPSTVFTYISIPHKDLLKNNNKIGIRNDYKKLIMKASKDIDSCNPDLDENFCNDFDDINDEYYNRYKIVDTQSNEDKEKYKL